MKNERLGLDTLDKNQRYGLVVVSTISFIVLVFCGSACAPEQSRFLGAGIGGVIGFLLISAVVIFAVKISPPGIKPDSQGRS